MRTLLGIVLLITAANAQAATHTLALDAGQRARLAAAATASPFVLTGVPDGHGGHADLRFERIEVYAPGARLIAIGADGERELPRSSRIQLIGTDSSGQVRAHLAFDPDLGHLAGSGSGPSGTFVIGARSDRDKLRLLVQPSEEALPPGVVPEVLPSDDGVANPFALPPPLVVLGADAVAGTPRSATVAVDVDHELLVNRFGGTAPANVSAATNWIADLFASMNVMYRRDLNVSLQQGTTIFRTGATPYTIAVNAAANGTDLNNFGSYWQANHANVPRAFAMLLSGQMTSGFSASGIAWINSYCRTASNGGSYSVNKVFTSAQAGVDLSARIVGHELGHNFGAAHTHCTNTSTGAYPTASNTIDRCYNGEGSCYTGPVSCPSSGPGAPLGSIMSYCHLGGANGANCGQSVLQFHPTQVATLSALIAQNTPTCIAASADKIFSDGFD